MNRHTIIVACCALLAAAAAETRKTKGERPRFKVSGVDIVKQDTSAHVQDRELMHVILTLEQFQKP